MTATPMRLTRTYVACQIVLGGLYIVIPLMQAELLSFPKLARSYFTVLTFVLELHSEQFAQFSGQPQTPSREGRIGPGTSI